MPKIVLRVKSSDALEALAARAADREIPPALVRDTGRTVVEAGTATCLGLGQTASAVIDELTGQLRLVR
jgi:peptidyl-tRNA hydrolase